MDFPNLGPVFSVDTETTGLVWWRDKVFGIAACPQGGEPVYFDIRRTPKAVNWIADQMARARKIVAHKANFDIHMLREAGAKPPVEKFECTMIREALIYEHHLEYNLDFLAKKRLGEGKVVMAKVDKERMADLPFETVSEYARPDARLCMRLWEWQQGEIESQNLHQVLALEQRLMPWIIEQERGGIRVDADAAERAMKRLDLEIRRKQKELDRLAGFPVNANPSGSIHKLFDPKKDADGVWRSNDGTILEKTPAGKPSLSAESLHAMSHPAAPLVLSIRQMVRMRDVFLAGHVLGHINPKTGMVHPNINQTKGDGVGVGPGRLSYSDPALQQIPSRDKEMAAIIRPVFLADPGHNWVYGDLEQHEFRIFAHYTNDAKIIQIYKDNPDADFHGLVAKLTGLPRNPQPKGGGNAKQLNLSIVFSMGAGLIAKKLGLPYTSTMQKFGRRERVLLKATQETYDVLDKYHEAIPGVRRVTDEATSIARSRGYVKSFFGRHLRFPDRDFAYKAAGLVYQGSSADLNKYNIINICEAIKGSDSRFLLNIHDEYSLSMPTRDLKLAKRMQEAIQDRPNFYANGTVYSTKLRVPIRIDFKSGVNWWEATNGEKIT